MAGATWFGVRVSQASGHLADARTALESARTHLLAREVPAAESDVRRAADETRAARGVTQSLDWRAAARVPLLGRSLRTVSVVAASAENLTERALPTALAEARRLDPERIRGKDGAIDLAYLRAARPGVDRALAQAGEARAQARTAPSSLLLPGVGKARERFLGSSQGLAEALLSARRALDVAPALLGADRPRRYFVAVQQNAESRGTGGLIGGYAVLEARSGRISVLSQGSDRDLYDDERAVDPPAGLPTGFTPAYGPYSVFASWQNINLPPQLPAVEKLIAAKWQKRTGQSIDGVIALDGQALQDLLTGSEPLQVGAKRVAVKDLASFLWLGQYEGQALDDASKDRRKDSLEGVAASVLTRVTGSGAGSADLLKGVVRAIRSGHLRMASSDPALQVLRLSGIDGALPTGPAPVAYPVLFNAQGSKLDQWTQRAVEWSCDGDRVRVDVRLRSALPPYPLPQYVALDLTQNPKVVLTRTNGVHLDVYTTKGARLVEATLDDKAVTGQALVHGVVGGLPFWGMDLSLPEGKERRFTLVLEGAGEGRVRMPEQPLPLPLVKEGSEGC